MLKYRLSGAEGSRGTEGTALGHGQEGIDTANLGDKGLGRAKLLGIALHGLLDGLCEDHGEFLLLTLAVFNDTDGVMDIVGALFLDGLNCPVRTLQGERNHNVVGEQSFRNRTHGASGLYGITCGNCRCEFPVAIRDCIQIHASFQEETALFCQLRKGVLQTVIYLCQQTGAQIHTHEFSCELNRVTDLDTIRHFVDLHAGHAVVDTDNLALQALIINENITYLVLADRAIEINFDKVAVDAGHISCLCFHITLPLQTVYLLLYPVEERLELCLALLLFEAGETLQQL